MADLEDELTEGVIEKKVVVVHHCTQEKTLGEILGVMKRVIQEVYGNGQKGLSQTVPAQTIRIDNLAEEIKLLCTNVSALMKYMNETAGGVKAVEKLKLSRTQWTAIIISAIVSSSAIIVTIILKVYVS